jgi:Transcriptional regulatory protein, C terminal
VQIGTRMLGRARVGASDADTEPQGEPGAARPPGPDGTLLAVVPIPGTGTSLAIVGYQVTAAGAAAIAPGTPVLDATVFDATILDGPVLNGSVLNGSVLNGSVLNGSGPDGAGPGTAGARSGLLLDHDQRRLWVDGAEVTLTFQEFELLAFLAAHPTTVFSRADLVREVWQRDFAADSRTVDVHVSRLRHKLGPAYGKCLVTEYRLGYQFRPPTR